jgi:hypothetical protein
MTPIFPPPIKLPSFIFHSATNVWSALIVSITALLYLAMTLSSFLPKSDAKQSKPGPPHKLVNQGEEK